MEGGREKEQEVREGTRELPNGMALFFTAELGSEAGERAVTAPHAHPCHPVTTCYRGT